METKITKSLRYYPPGVLCPVGHVKHESRGVLASCRAPFGRVAFALQGIRLPDGANARQRSAEMIVAALNAANIEARPCK